ncbi:MAG: sensor domain-containing diguanylate cyclase, partial [Chloroherpetonaceae bacterium]|nr:sensor domain-containing diguanylate cyclase [Chthonomonadaceae bacterium]MDW8209105.1 sensor domain-containing diguanylate cyclase [Chloroherpetonaceae bacterium]
LPPLLFVTVFWFGPFYATTGSLIGCFLLSRFVARSRIERRALRMQGAQLAIAAFAADQVLSTMGRSWSLQWQFLSDPQLLIDVTGALRLTVTALYAAVVFLLTYALLHAGSHLSRWRAWLRSPDAEAHCRLLLRTYGLGMGSAVLVAPLGTRIGLMASLPLCVMLLLVGHIVWLHREVADLRNQLRVNEVLGHASISEAAELDVRPLLTDFLQLSERLVSAERAIVWTLSQTTGVLTPTVGLPDKGIYADHKALFGEGLIGHAAARLAPRLVPNAARDRHRGYREPASGAWLLYPIVVHDRILGVAQWIRPVHRPFTQEDVRRLAGLIPQAAIALENVRIREAMHHQAATDGLTGLWNHRKMQELLRHEMRRAARYHRALAVLMMDVDSFKTFNDTYGHPQGDRLLRRITGILRDSMRTTDHLGRYGGEEFLVILPETTKDDACRLAERIRSAVEEHAWLQISDQIVRRTVSVGVASYPEDALNPTDLIQCADEALYRAKRAGKNCVVWA